MFKKTIRYIPFIVSALLFLLLQSKIYNLGINYRDEGFLVNNAWQINQGLIPYKDFFLTTTPLTFYAQSILFRLFGDFLITDRIFYIVLILVLLFCSNKMFNLSLFSSTLLASFIAISQIGAGGFAFYNTETLVLIFVSLIVVKSAISLKNKLLIIVLGIICGILFLFKQSIGGSIIVAYLISLYFYMGLSYIPYYISGIISVILPFLTYFYVKNALNEMFYYTFTFAASVKNYGFPFVIHRLIPISMIFVYGYLSRYISLRKKIIIPIMGLIAILVYILSDPSRSFIFLHSLKSFLFYFQMLIYCISVKLLYPAYRLKRVKFLYVYTIILLASFFGYAMSGYSTGIVITIFPLIIILLFYLYESVHKKQLFYKTFLLFSILSTTTFITLFIFKSNFKRNSKIYNIQLIEDSTYFTEIPQFKGIKVTEVEKYELEKIYHYTQENVKPSDHVFCFPYCPMVNFFTYRNNPTNFSFYFGETFGDYDQVQIINKLKIVQPVLIIQKKGSIEPEAEYENLRLNLIVDYINSKTIIYESDNFIIKRMQ